ncbi:MAG: hypothetical protein E7293_11465 [Lachnospiraceae bacterium]|nr:hypothetical protein [Lachnospiraceae bacterium]
MASKGQFYKSSPLSLVQQKVALCLAYKDAKCNIDKKKNQLFWIGKIRPTAFSYEYTVFLLYQAGKSPKVWVMGDELERLDDVNFPHKFDVDAENKMVRICLYRYSEFNSSKLLANTIIPWTVEWLYFYELWLATGEWLGGGEHPSDGKPKVEDINKE